MWEFIIEIARTNGVWAALFVGVLVQAAREIRSSHREQLAAKEAEILRLLQEKQFSDERNERLSARLERIYDNIESKWKSQ